MQYASTRFLEYLKTEPGMEALKAVNNLVQTTGMEMTIPSSHFVARLEPAGWAVNNEDTGSHAVVPRPSNSVEAQQLARTCLVRSHLQEQFAHSNI